MMNWFIKLTPSLLVELIKKRTDYAAKNKISNINVLVKKQFIMPKIFEMKFFTTSDYGKFTSEIIHAKRKSINGKV